MTKENLAAAFAGESQAHMKYLAFAAKALFHHQVLLGVVGHVKPLGPRLEGAQEAMISLLRLYDRYGWKEQLRNDVESVRAEVQRQGGVSEDTIDEAISRYRRRPSA